MNSNENTINNKIYLCYCMIWENGIDFNKKQIDIGWCKTLQEAQKWTRTKNKALLDLKLFDRERKKIMLSSFKDKTGLKHPDDVLGNYGGKYWQVSIKAHKIWDKLAKQYIEDFHEFREKHGTIKYADEYKYKELDLIIQHNTQ